MKAIRTAVLVCVAAIGAAAPARAQDDVSAMLDAMGYGERWVSAFGQRWDSLQTRAAMPAGTVRLVLSMLESGDLPADPADAAAELYGVVRAVERQRLGGEPLWRIKLRLEQEIRKGGRGVGLVAKKLRPAKRSGVTGQGQSGQNADKGRGGGSGASGDS